MKKNKIPVKKELSVLRAQINKLDETIIWAVADRMAVSRAVGEFKKRHVLKIKDPAREKALKKFHQKLADKYGITAQTLQKIFALIMKESRRIQK